MIVHATLGAGLVMLLLIAGSVVHPRLVLPALGAGYVFLAGVVVLMHLAGVL